MFNLSYIKHTSVFKQPGGTSRGVLHTKDSWIISLTDPLKPGHKGMGEASIIQDLSIDRPELIGETLAELAGRPIDDTALAEPLLQWLPALHAGLEMALIGAKNRPGIWFESAFTEGIKPIPINGLIWMGSHADMLRQIREKLDAGYTCIKLKIGAIDFNDEVDLLKKIRSEFSASLIELRLDANGAFSPSTAPEKLKVLSDFSIHSIEQPIKPGQWQEMARLCSLGIIDIALDEELIGFSGDKKHLLETINPRYIILKPSLLGGFHQSEQWIQAAEKSGIGWWATSALETNIGLNAIAQWVATFNAAMPQGLGTGQLFTNNFPAPLVVKNGYLHYLKT